MKWHGFRVNQHQRTPKNTQKLAEYKTKLIQCIPAGAKLNKDTIMSKEKNVQVTYRGVGEDKGRLDNTYNMMVLLEGRRSFKNDRLPLDSPR